MKSTGIAQGIIAPHRRHGSRDETDDEHPVVGPAILVALLDGASCVMKVFLFDKASKPIPAPQKLRGLRGLTWLDDDPHRDGLYLMKMTNDLYRLKRRK